MAKFIIQEPFGGKYYRADKTPLFESKKQAEAYLSNCPSLGYKCRIKKILG